MTQSIEPPKKPPVQSSAPAAAHEDLSESIRLSLEKQPDEEIRCVRLFGDHYRCNWWVWDLATYPKFIRTGTIRKSRFLRATKIDGRLVVEGMQDKN